MKVWGTVPEKMVFEWDFIGIFTRDLYGFMVFYLKKIMGKWDNHGKNMGK